MSGTVLSSVLLILRMRTGFSHSASTAVTSTLVSDQLW
jgi:hypothetical protein